MRFAGIALLFALVAHSAQRVSVEAAWELLAKNQRAEAVQVLRQVVAKDRANAEAHLMLGSILDEDSKSSEAITLLREAVRLAPSAMAYNALGEALSRVTDTPGAKQAFAKAVQLDPRFALAQENLGATCLASGDLAAAARHLDRAIALYGKTEDGAQARYLRAKVFTESNDVPKAVTHLEWAVALRPDFPEAWSDLGQAYRALEQNTMALAALQRSVKLNPNAHVAQTRLGALYLTLDKPSEAVLYLERAVSLEPTNQTALNNLQQALRATGQEEKAAAVRKQLADVFRQRDETAQKALEAVQRNNEGSDLEKAGKLAEAALKYREALSLNPGHAGIRANYAVALLRLGRWAEGIRELRVAVEQDPSNEKLQRGLRDALAQAPPGVAR